jgi:hypothetical protein
MLIEVVWYVTTIAFTIEMFLKIIAEGTEPLNFFFNPDNGKFNSLDLFILIAGYALMQVESGSAIGALRLLRLVRLLTFIKGVPELRAIIGGCFKVREEGEGGREGGSVLMSLTLCPLLIFSSCFFYECSTFFTVHLYLVQGLSSVVYIVLLLVLFVYIFGILGVMIFGENDPARFGTVGNAMISLLQVATLASWTNVAYTSWYGCGEYNGDAYAAALETDPPSRITTVAGIVQGFKCKIKYIYLLSG